MKGQLECPSPSISFEPILSPGYFGRQGSATSTLSPSVDHSAAAKQAKVLALRRQSKASTPFISEGSSERSRKASTSTPFLGEGAGERSVVRNCLALKHEIEVDLSELKEAVGLLKTSVLEECRALHKKFDGVISSNERLDKSLSHIQDSLPWPAAASSALNGGSATSEDFARSSFEDVSTGQSIDFAAVRHGLQATAGDTFVNKETSQVRFLSQNGRSSACIADEIRPSENSRSSIRGPSIRGPSIVSTISSFDSITKSLMARTRHRNNIAKLMWVYLEDPALLPSGQAYHRMMTMLVLASVCLMIVQTSDPPPFGRFTENVVAYAVDGLITTEIIVRFTVCPNRRSFFVDLHNLIDVANGPVTLLFRMALLVFFSGMLPQPEDTARALLNFVLPILRLLKILRRFESAHLIYKALARASEVLPVLLYVLVVIITAFASILYRVEPRDSIRSLPDACWLAIVTLSTVGYGDVCPVTQEGKLVVTILIFMAAVYMAMPIGIVGKVFSEVWDDRSRLLLTQLARRRFKIAGYTPADIPAMFLFFDQDRDGLLSVAEFTDMMKHMQFDVSGKRVLELFNTFDADGSGAISDEEFLETLFPDAALLIYGEMDHAKDPASVPVDDPIALEGDMVSSCPFLSVLSHSKEATVDVGGELGGVIKPESSAGCDAFSVPNEKHPISAPDARLLGCDDLNVPNEKDPAFSSESTSHCMEATAEILGKAEAVVEAVSQADGCVSAVEGQPVAAIHIPNSKLHSSCSNMVSRHMPAVARVNRDFGHVASVANVELDFASVRSA